MFWAFLAASAVGAALLKLGALTVMVSVLSLALRILLAVGIVFAVVYVLGRISKA